MFDSVYQGACTVISEERDLQVNRRSEEGGSYDGPDRRRMTCGILYSCYGAIGEVEDWLDDHCQGDFDLVLEGMDEDLIRKSLKIMFELESDKATFISQFAKKSK